MSTDKKEILYTCTHNTPHNGAQTAELYLDDRGWLWVQSSLREAPIKIWSVGLDCVREAVIAEINQVYRCNLGNSPHFFRHGSGMQMLLMLARHKLEDPLT